MKWAIYALGAVVLVGALMFAGFHVMPNKSTWAEDFAEFSQSLPEDAALRQQLQPLLSDGKLSLWELSQLHCQSETSCMIDNFLSTYTDPQTADMFAGMVLEILKRQASQSGDSGPQIEDVASGEI